MATEHNLQYNIVTILRNNGFRPVCTDLMAGLAYLSNMKRIPFVNHMKKMGWEKGISDLIIIYRGGVTFVELKRPGNKPTIEQENYLREMSELGFETCCWTTVEECRDWCINKKNEIYANRMKPKPVSDLTNFAESIIPMENTTNTITAKETHTKEVTITQESHPVSTITESELEAMSDEDKVKYIEKKQYVLDAYNQDSQIVRLINSIKSERIKEKMLTRVMENIDKYDPDMLNQFLQTLDKMSTPIPTKGGGINIQNILANKTETPTVNATIGFDTKLTSVERINSVLDVFKDNNIPTKDTESKEKK